MLGQLHRSTQEIQHSHKFRQHQQPHPLALFGWPRWKPVTGKFIYICIYIHTYSLDPHITGLRHPVYPVTAPGSPGLPVASPTGRHTHAHRHKQVSPVAGPGTGIEVTWQWYCKGLWKRRCAQGCLPHAATWMQWWKPGCSSASGTGHRMSTVTQGSPQRWFNSRGDIASEALDGFLTIIEGSILIFNQTLALWPVRFVYNLPASPCSDFSQLKTKRKIWHCNITAYVGKQCSALTLQPQR